MSPPNFSRVSDLLRWALASWDADLFQGLLQLLNRLPGKAFEEALETGLTEPLSHEYGLDHLTGQLLHQLIGRID